MITRLHHIGMGVKDIEKVISFYENLGFSKTLREKFSFAEAAFIEKDDMRLELFEFDDAESDIAKMATKHQAFVSDNLEADVQHFIDAGYQLAIPIQNDGAGDVRRFAYVKDANNNFIELCELS